MYTQVFATVWPLLVLTAGIAVVAPKVPRWTWMVINVVSGILLGAFGGLVSFTAIATGGNPDVGPAALLSFAGGLTWAAVWLLYYWEHRSKA